jgi:hypothetical protein
MRRQKGTLGDLRAYGISRVTRTYWARQARLYGGFIRPARRLPRVTPERALALRIMVGFGVARAGALVPCGTRRCKRMGQALGFRFNPPPGWPRCPEGFVPPPGWQPDPRWPGPPPGWQFWLSDNDPSSAAAPSEVARPDAAHVPHPGQVPAPGQMIYPGQVTYAGQGPHSGQPAYPGQPASPRQRAQSGRWLLTGLGAVCVALIVASYLYFPAQMKGSGTRPGLRILVPPPPPAAAGGLTRDYTAERTTHRVALAQLRSRLKLAPAGTASSYAAVVYDEPGHTDPATKGPVRLVFLGINAPSSPGDPSASLKNYMAGLAAGIAGHGALSRPAPVPAGPGGGKAECAEATAGAGEATICAWATDWTLGSLSAPSRDASISELAGIMRLLRPDFEHR